MRILSYLIILCLWTYPAMAADPLPAGKIAAVVNGELITVFDLQQEMMPEMMRMRLDPKDPKAAPQLEQLSQMVLENMIKGIILTQEAERLKVNVSEAEVEAELKNFLLQQKLTPAEFEKQLLLQGSSEKEFRKRIVNSLLRNRLLESMVARKIVVTRDEVKEYYDLHKDTFMSNQSVDFSMLVYPPSMSTKEVEQSAERLKKDPAGFESLVKKISIGPRAEEGGHLGELPWEDVNQALRDVLTATTVGQVSTIFTLNSLPCQVKVNKLLSGSGQTLEQATGQIEAILREPKAQVRFEEYMDQLRRRAVVNIKM